MIDLHHPLAVLASRLPWAQIEAALAPHFARQARARAVQWHKTTCLALLCKWLAARRRRRRSPRLPIRLMPASLLYLKRQQAQRRGAGAALGGGTWSGSTSAACASTNHACRVTPRRSDAFVQRLARPAWKNCQGHHRHGRHLQTIGPAEFERLIVDTTVQEKAIARGGLTPAEIARHKVVIARQAGGHCPEANLCAREGRPCGARPAATPMPSAVQATQEDRQAPAHHPRHRVARGGAQDQADASNARPRR